MTFPARPLLICHCGRLFLDPQALADHRPTCTTDLDTQETP